MVPGSSSCRGNAMTYAVRDEPPGIHQDHLAAAATATAAARRRARAQDAPADALIHRNEPQRYALPQARPDEFHVQPPRFRRRGRR